MTFPRFCAFWALALCLIASDWCWFAVDVWDRFHGESSIQAIEWIPRVPFEGRAFREAEAWQDGFTAFCFTEYDKDGRLVSAGRRAEYFPVFYVEPYEGNEIALGFVLLFCGNGESERRLYLRYQVGRCEPNLGNSLYRTAWLYCDAPLNAGMVGAGGMPLVRFVGFLQIYLFAMTGRADVTGRRNPESVAGLGAKL